MCIGGGSIYKEHFRKYLKELVIYPPKYIFDKISKYYKKGMTFIQFKRELINNNLIKYDGYMEKTYSLLIGTPKLYLDKKEVDKICKLFNILCDVAVPEIRKRGRSICISLTYLIKKFLILIGKSDKSNIIYLYQYSVIKKTKIEELWKEICSIIDWPYNSICVSPF